MASESVRISKEEYVKKLHEVGEFLKKHPEKVSQISETAANDLCLMLPKEYVWELIEACQDLPLKLSEEACVKLRTDSNPYAKMVQTDTKENQYFCFSAINFKDEYMKRFKTTSLVAFIYRMLDEYELKPKEIGHFPGLLSPSSETDSKGKGKEPEQGATDGKESHEAAQEFIKHHIMMFLNKYLEYNPDIHVKSSYEKNDKDPERTPLLIENGENKETAPERKHIPPRDTFHRWQHYEDVNYDTLRETTDDIYGLKSDVEYAYMPYGGHETLEDAQRWQRMHYNEVTAEIYCAKAWKWTIMTSCAQNRERIDFFNKKTELIQRMLKYAEVQQKIGIDMMKKRAAIKKKENEEELGEEDNTSTKKFFQSNPSRLGAWGAERIEPIKAEQVPRDDGDLPDDAIEVNVIELKNDPKNKDLKVNKWKMHTKAEPVESADVMTASMAQKEQERKEEEEAAALRRSRRH